MPSGWWDNWWHRSLRLLWVEPSFRFHKDTLKKFRKTHKFYQSEHKIIPCQHCQHKNKTKQVGNGGTASPPLHNSVPFFKNGQSLNNKKKKYAKHKTQITLNLLLNQCNSTTTETSSVVAHRGAQAAPPGGAGRWLGDSCGAERLWRPAAALLAEPGSPEHWPPTLGPRGPGTTRKRKRSVCPHRHTRTRTHTHTHTHTHKHTDSRWASFSFYALVHSSKNSMQCFLFKKCTMLKVELF